MAEPPPPPPPAADVGFKGKGAKVAWVPKSHLKHEGSSIPIPIPSPIPISIPIRTPPPPAGYRPYGYGAGPNSFGIQPYGYGYGYHQCVRPVLQPQPRLQVVAMNGFVGNGGKRQTTLFGLVRRGTGVFHPPTVHNRPNTTTNKVASLAGWRDRRDESTCQIRRSNNGSKENDDDCSVKLEECHEQTPSSEIGLPQEWTYEPNIL